MSTLRSRVFNAAAFCAVIGFAAAPASAHAGFLDQLFGIQPAAPVAPVPYDVPRSQADFGGMTAAPVHRHRKVVAFDAKSQKQTPTDLMHDKTLQPGDAVMMKTGLAVYEGPRSSIHDKDEFVRLSEDDNLSRKERATLVAMDTSRPMALVEDGTANQVSTGRSAAVASPIAAGYRITDARGRSIRYVGP